ncbi:carotenoid oxygenase [Dunaliella salina]|uniref:Carotenoid oxygenase n=1 Tax=Dunaliella salina TaxID=3046 RepID=A0ABQ7H5U6_DUNSA|nr:carotenoid oxygenase [Dunaliella salina]|eukprot:KAF5842235.1 carotenoid oxygenase [Dunaliella salina]
MYTQTFGFQQGQMYSLQNTVNRQRLAGLGHPSATRPSSMPSCPLSGAVKRRDQGSFQPHIPRVAAPEAPTVTSTTEGANPVSHISQEARKSFFSKKENKEEEEVLEVSGQIPEWLNGSLITNGGGDFDGMHHLFDGLAMLTKIKVSNGRVYASQKYLESEQYRHVQQTGKRKFGEFGTPLPASNPLEQAVNIMSTVGGLVTRTSVIDNASVNVIPLADGKMFTSTETVESWYKIDPSNLATLEKVDLRGDGIPGDLTTAHPKLLRDGRTFVNFSRSIPAGGFHVFKQDATTLQRKEIAFIRDQDPGAPAWVHDMGYSGNHIIICEIPLFFNLAALVTGETREYMMFDWKPELGSRIHLVPLDGSAHKTYKTAPFHVFHHANGFEEDGQVHLDMGYYETPKGLNDMKMSSIYAFPGEEYEKSYLRRLSIPLDAPTGSSIPPPRQLSSQPEQYGELCDFTVVNPEYRGLKHRYVYALAAVRPTNLGNALAKHDTLTGEAQTWHEPGGATGECVFVPRPGAQAEDDGVVLVQHMGADGRTSLVILDAQRWQELGRARLPYGMPYRFHGSFMPEKQ